MGTGRAGRVWMDFSILPDWVGFAKLQPVDHPLRWSDRAVRLIGFTSGSIGFRGFLLLQQQTKRKSPQQGNNKHHRNKKTHHNNHNKKSTKHNNNKSANTLILDRIGEGEADAVAEPTRSGQNPMRSHQIRRDLTWSGTFTWRWSSMRSDHGVAVELEVPSPVVEIQISCFFLWNWKENERGRKGRLRLGGVREGKCGMKKMRDERKSVKKYEKMREERESVKYTRDERVFLFYKY